MGTGEWFYNSTKGLQRPEMLEIPKVKKAVGMKEKGSGRGLLSQEQSKTAKELVQAEKHVEVRGSEEVANEKASEQNPNQMAEEVIKPMSMMMIKGGLGSSSTTSVGCKKTVSTVKKAQEKSDVERSPKEAGNGKFSIKSSEVKVEEKRPPGKEKKKSLPAWMEKIERQLGLLSLDELANF